MAELMPVMIASLSRDGNKISAATSSGKKSQLARVRVQGSGFRV
jgi:hypothetical protein